MSVESATIIVELFDGEVVELTVEQTETAIVALLSDTMFEGSTSMAAQLQAALDVLSYRDSKVTARAAESVAFRRVVPS